MKAIVRFIRKNPTGFFVGMRQEVVERPAGAAQESKPVAGAGETAVGPSEVVPVSQELCSNMPKLGSRFSDEKLGARLGVPPWGGIRVSHENRCVVLVDRGSGGDSHTDADIGGAVRYIGQDRRGGGEEEEDQALDGANLDLALSKARGYMVLYFTREGADLVFDKVVKCDSICFEKRGDRNVVVFKLVVDDEAGGYKKFNPEVEGILESIESGTLVGEEYTIDEYIAYVKKVTG